MEEQYTAMMFPDVSIFLCQHLCKIYRSQEDTSNHNCKVEIYNFIRYMRNILVKVNMPRKNKIKCHKKYYFLDN